MRWKNLLHPDILWGLLFLGLGTLPFLFTDLDLILSSRFFHQGWEAGDRGIWLFLYRFGPWPGLAVSALGLAGLFGSWIRPGLESVRRPALLIVLTLLLGPGLLVNSLGKEYWGRPRPREIQAFGGSREFHRVCRPGVPGRGKSFPCGHASVGYLLTAFYFIHRRSRWKFLWLGGGLAWGSMIGLARMAQGGHFASDVLWAGGATYLTAAVLYHGWLKFPPNSPAGKTVSPAVKIAGWSLLGVSLALLSLFFLAATPYFKEWSGKVPVPPGTTSILLTFSGRGETLSWVETGPDSELSVRAELQGFGFPKLRLTGALFADQAGTTLQAKLDLKLNHWVTERTGRVVIQTGKGVRLFVGSSGKRAE